MSTTQFLDLPPELIHRILSLLSPIELATCQLVNKHLNVVISGSLILQYSFALTLAKADNNPSSVVPLPQKLEDIRSSEAAWAALQPKFITSIPVKHRTSGIYDLSAGTYLLGNVDGISLHYLQLPTRAGDPLNWKKITMDKTIVDMGFCVFEHDLIAVITSSQSPIQSELLDIEMTLLEYSTGRPHPRAKNSTIFIMSSPIRPSLMCEIVGENLVLRLHFTQGEDRIFIWDWRTNVLKTAFLSPDHSSSGILFLEEDLIILPNAESAAFDFFRIPKKPTANTLKPIFSLMLPSLEDGMEIDSITCRAEPNPIPDISRLNKRQRAQERADAGMDDMDPLAPKRGFLASAEDAICIIQIRFANTIIFQGGMNVLERTGDSYTLFVHRSSFLKMARQYEEISNTSNFPLPENRADAGVTLDPRRIAWVDWGPPVSRWFNANATPTQWITTSSGQRCVMIHNDVGTYGTPFTILDFNPFNIRKLKAKSKRKNETAKEKLDQELRPIAEVMEGVDQSAFLPETTMGNLADEKDGPLASETGGLTAISQDMEDGETADTDLSEDDHYESWIADSDDISVGQVSSDTDSDASIPGLKSLANSDEEPCAPSGYITNPQDYRYPGLAVCRVFEDPSTVGSSETFAEEVEGRLPYVAYVSEREYEYGAALLDEERILAMTTDENGLVIDIYYFG